MTLIARRSSPSERGFVCIDPALDALPRYRTVEPTADQLDRQVRRMHNAFLALEHRAADNRATLPPRLRTRLAAFMTEWRELGLHALRPPGESGLAVRGVTSILLDDFIADFNVLERQVDEAIAAGAPAAPDGPGRAIATGITSGIGRALLVGLGVAAVGGMAYYVATRRPASAQ